MSNAVESNAVERWKKPQAAQQVENNVNQAVSAVATIRAVKTEKEISDDIKKFEASDFTDADLPAWEYYASVATEDNCEAVMIAMEAQAKAKKITQKVFKAGLNAIGKKYKLPQPQQVAAVVTNGFTGAAAKFFNGSEPVFGEEYIATDNGVFRVYKGENLKVCARPILISKIYKNINTECGTVDISFYREGGWKTIRQIPLSDVSNPQKLATILSSRGLITVTGKNGTADELTVFLADFYERNSDGNNDIIPKRDTTDTIGWMPDGTFAPFDGNIEVDAMSSDQSLASMSGALHKAGDAEAWIKAINEKRALPNSVPMRVMIAASLASVLIEPMHRLPFWVHMRGKRDTGKTVTMRVASTVWGKAELNDGWMRTMLGTDVGFEMLAGFARNLPLCLNELQVAQRADKSFAEIVYKLCEGSGKIRGSRSGGLQKTRSWRLIVLSCGEDQIITAEEKGGANTRVIEINLSNSIYDDPQEFCSNVLDKHYGHAGPMFIDGLKHEDMDKLTAEWLEITKRWTAAGKARKQADAGALLMVADRLAEKYVFKDGVLLTDNDICQYLKTDDATDDDLACFDALQSLITAKHRNFSTDGTKPDGDCWGRIKTDNIYDITANKSLPYIWVFFDKKFCDSELKHMGYDAQRFVEWSFEHGYLIKAKDPKPGREYVQQKKLYTGANGTWCYVFKILNEGDDETPKKDDPKPTSPVTTHEPVQQEMDCTHYGTPTPVDVGDELPF